MSFPAQVNESRPKTASSIWMQRAKALLHKLEAKATKEWDELELAPAGSLKARVHKAATRMISSVDPVEVFLKHVHPPQGHDHSAMLVVHPSGVDKGTVQKKLLDLGTREEAHHKRLLVLWGLAVPLTASMTILPGPNIFLFWNVFRVYSHYKALKGAQCLLASATVCDYQSDEKLEGLVGAVASQQRPCTYESLRAVEEYLSLPHFAGHALRSRTWQPLWRRLLRRMLSATSSPSPPPAPSSQQPPAGDASGAGRVDAPAVSLHSGEASSRPRQSPS
jgi:hypothetical protein